jgi:hypothetical protein
MPEIAQEILLAGVREVVFRALELREGDSSQRRAFKLQLAAWAADRAGLLPRPGIAIVLGKTSSWVTYAIAATERRRTAHYGFRQHSDKLVEALTEALTGPQMRRV